MTKGETVLDGGQGISMSLVRWESSPLVIIKRLEIVKHSIHATAIFDQTLQRNTKPLHHSSYPLLRPFVKYKSTSNRNNKPSISTKQDSHKMMIYYGAKKLSEKRKAKKANEADDGISQPNSKDQSKPVCPQCQETSKIDFQRRYEGGDDATWATCRKCGSQWRHK